MSNPYYRWALSLEPDGKGGYRRDDELGGMLVSEEGMRKLVVDGRVYEEHVDALEAVTSRLAPCTHGRDLAQDVEDGVLEWGINDYVCDPERDPGATIFILSGWHGDDYCIPVGYHAAGVVFRW